MQALEELEKKGYKLIDIVAGDVQLEDDLKYVLTEIEESKQGTFYSDLLFSLTSVRFSENESKRLWQDILSHKYLISEKLRRNIGIHVAALDYLENVKRIIKAPKILDEKEYTKTLKLARTDALTGVFNRRYFIECLRKEMEVTKTYKEGKYKFCLLMLDMDNFKNYNDTLGHHAGDLVLQELVRILKSNVRATDVIARYGGDEMIILLSQTNKEKARLIAEKIRTKVEESFKDYQITVSIGLIECPTDCFDEDEEKLIDCADEILYRAKEFGKNRVSWLHQIVLQYKPGDDSPLQSVSVVGDFNQWNKNQTKMSYVENEKIWQVVLFLKEGQYRYKFLVDGSKWIADPRSTESVDDGFCGKCSLLTVTVTK